MFRATAIKKALKSAASSSQSRLTPRGGFQAGTRRNMSGGGSIEEEIGEKKSRSIASSLLSPTTIRSLFLSLMTTDIRSPFCR
jgi:hypothetical protein|tara:strand:+ start:198 stop:446 length:249 start_codon:yes stop_codon:yes gene_type:complete